MKKHLILLCLLVSTLTLMAQDDFYNSKHAFSLAYFGETFTHPGFSLGYEKTLKSWKKEKVKKNGKEKIRYKRWLWSNQYAFYHHTRNHSGNMLTTGLNYSRTKPKGGFFEIGLFAGGNYRVFNEDVYSVSDIGIVSKINSAGNMMFVTGLNTSIGKVIRSKKEATPYSLFFSSNTFLSLPFGTRFITNSAVEIGLKYQL